MISWGRVALGTVLPFMFTTYDGATGASEEGSGLAVTDIEIYKAGVGLTQRSSDAGYALLDADGHALDSIVGLAGFTVDTGDNTDAGFFVAGGYYIGVVASVTVDAQTVNFIAGTFSLGPTLTVAGVEEVDVTHWLGTAAATPTVAGVPEVDLTHVAGSTTNVSALATNVDAILTDTGTTLDGRIPAALVGGRIDANLGAISGSTNGVAALQRSADSIVRCTVGAASTTTNIVTSACSPSGAVADQFKGRIVIFDANTTTAALRGQATDITASTNAATPELTVTALTTAPVSGDAFVIV